MFLLAWSIVVVHASFFKCPIPCSTGMRAVDWALCAVFHSLMVSGSAFFKGFGVGTAIWLGWLLPNQVAVVRQDTNLRILVEQVGNACVFDSGLVMHASGRGSSGL